MASAAINDTVESIRTFTAAAHAMITEGTSNIECQANRHLTVNARLSANRARKAINAAIVDMENAARLLDAAHKES